VISLFHNLAIVMPHVPPWLIWSTLNEPETSESIEVRNQAVYKEHIQDSDRAMSIVWGFKARGGEAVLGQGKRDLVSGL
jgi:hypothetical protein